MKKQLLLMALLCLGSLSFAQTKEHKTYIKDIVAPSYGYQNDQIPCVMTVSYYENKQGKMVYDGPFSVIGKERVWDYEIDLGDGHAEVLYEMEGSFKDGLLDGNYSFTRTYDFKSNKGVEAPNKWVKTGSFHQGVPEGEWNYIYTRKKTIASVHFTIRNRKAVGSFYSQGFEIDQNGSTQDGILEKFEEKFRGETTAKSVYYKGVDISENADVARKYADGQITLEELEDMGYYVVEYERNILQDIIDKHVFLGDFEGIFGKSVLEKALENQYRNRRDGICWMKAKGSSVREKQSPFWTPARVNAYIDDIKKISSYDGMYGLQYYYSDVESYYNSHSIKTVHYKKIMAALDEKKTALETPLVEEVKHGINSQTSMVDLNEYMKSKSDMTGNFADENKKAVNDAYKSKFAELEKKEFDAVMDAIKGNFDNEVMRKILTVFPTKDLYLAFGKDCKSKIDEALAKQPQAIEASTVVRMAFDQIVVVSQNKKISKKPVDVISADYSANPSSWEVFSGQSVQEQLPVKIAPFCPISGYKIVAADYLQNDGFSYTVEWTQQISKKEQKTYISNIVLSKDKKHVELDSFDFSKATVK
jgi:hypothetical protein